MTRDTFPGILFYSKKITTMKPGWLKIKLLSLPKGLCKSQNFTEVTVSLITHSEILCYFSALMDAVSVLLHGKALPSSVDIKYYILGVPEIQYASVETLK